VQERERWGRGPRALKVSRSCFQLAVFIRDQVENSCCNKQLLQQTAVATNSCCHMLPFDTVCFFFLLGTQAWAWSGQNLPIRRLWRRSDSAVRTGYTGVGVSDAQCSGAESLGACPKRETFQGSQMRVQAGVESVETGRTADVCNKPRNSRLGLGNGVRDGGS
jgi:hypothetical protein